MINRAFFNLPLSQHVPRYPGRQEHPLLCGVPEFLQASLLQARFSSRGYGHVPPQASTTVFDLVLLCVPLVPHWWLQALQDDHEPTWQFRAPHGGGARLRLLRRQGSVSRAKTSSTSVTAKNLVVHIVFLESVKWFRNRILEQKGVVGAYTVTWLHTLGIRLEAAGGNTCQIKLLVSIARTFLTPPTDNCTSCSSVWFRWIGICW